MNHGDDETPLTFIEEHIKNICVLIVDIAVHQELNEHNVEE